MATALVLACSASECLISVLLSSFTLLAFHSRALRCFSAGTSREFLSAASQCDNTTAGRQMVVVSLKCVVVESELKCTLLRLTEMLMLASQAVLSKSRGLVVRMLSSDI